MISSPLSPFYRVICCSDRDGKLPLVDSAVLRHSQRHRKPPDDSKRAAMTMAASRTISDDDSVVPHTARVAGTNTLPLPPSRLGPHSLSDWSDSLKRTCTLERKTTGKNILSSGKYSSKGVKLRAGNGGVNAGSGGVKNFQAQTEMLKLQSYVRNCLPITSSCKTRRHTHHMTSHVTSGRGYGDITPPPTPPYMGLEIGQRRP